MKTRIPTNVVSVNSYIFYALVTGSDSLKANFRPGAMADRIQTGFRNVKITDGNLKIGVRVGLEKVMGQRISKPMNGLNIVKTMYENGKVSVQNYFLPSFFMLRSGSIVAAYRRPNSRYPSALK